MAGTGAKERVTSRDFSGAERQLLIRAMLPTAPRRIALSELATRLENEHGMTVHVRTLQRDLTALARIDPEIEHDDTKPVGWFRKSGARLDADIELALTVGLPHTAGLLPPRVRARLRNRGRSRIEAPAPDGLTPSLENALFDAVARHATIAVHLGGGATLTLQVREIRMREGRREVVGCSVDGRQLAVSVAQICTFEEVTSDRNVPGNYDEDGHSRGVDLRVVVELSPGLAERWSRRAPPQARSLEFVRPPPRPVVAFLADDSRDLRRALFAEGPELTVLEPEWLREEFQAAFRRITSRYASGAPSRK